MIRGYPGVRPLLLETNSAEKALVLSALLGRCLWVVGREGWKQESSLRRAWMLDRFLEGAARCLEGDQMG